MTWLEIFRLEFLLQKPRQAENDAAKAENPYRDFLSHPWDGLRILIGDT